jgi:hypothetical protein
MTKHRLFIVGLVLLAITAAGLILCVPRSESTTRAAFDRIVPGMTEPEVQALLGRPPQSRTVVRGLVKDPERFVTNSDPGVQARDGHRDYMFCEWVVPHWDGTSYVAVVFDGDEVVCRYLTVAPPGLWDRVRMRLERLL